MVIALISDTHNQHKNLFIPSGVDMIIHSGDISVRGTEKEVIDFLSWFNNLPIKYKIFIGGNHDWYFEKVSKYIIDDLLKHYSNIIYLNDSGVEIEGINIWGSPVQPYFGGWAFNKFRGDEIQKHWNLIPNNTNILITHGPPLGYGDTVIRGGIQVGCQDLKNTIWKNPNIKYCVFGHIHEGYGVYKDGDKSFINASILDENYNMVNKPIIINFTDKMS